MQNTMENAMDNKVKNFSTIALLLALGLSISSSVFAVEEKETYTKAHANKCAFLANAPDQHVVVKRDTLWGISQMFLEHAWCWPQVWGMNRAEIKNPHWIYPGQIVYFDRAAGRLRLGKPVSRGGSGDIPDVRLSPQVRAENLVDNAISTIPANVIEPFLSQPLILEKGELANAPHIVAAEEGHVNIGKSEKAYVAGNLNDLTDFQVYRAAAPLIDPETKQLLGYESAYLGTVKLIKTGTTPDEAHSVLVTHSKEEMTVGDYLLPVPDSEPNNYVPHPPGDAVNGRIVSVYGGVALAGQNQTVSINRGSKDGIDIGTVLKLYRSGGAVTDKKHNNSVIKLPDEEYGTLFVYRVFNNVAYGLIMRVTDTAQIGDIVKGPE